MEEMILERVSFKSLVLSDQPVSEEKVFEWLSNPKDIEIEIAGDFYIDENPAYSTTIEDPQSFSSFTIFNLDPASAGVLIAGLSAILAWVSTERRHKETLSTTPPGSGKNNDVEDPDLCNKVEADKVCKLPLTNTMRVKGEGFIILFRACTKKPKPHTTVEYYEI